MQKPKTLKNSNLTSKKWVYFAIYTLFFALACIVTFAIFIKNGRGFIWGKEGSDGSHQHFPALAYVGQWGREIMHNIFVEHTFEIPMWDFSIGYGSDIVTTLNYYALGDPLNLLSIFVPVKYTEYLYNFLIVLRMYLAGVMFSLFCFKLNRSKWGTLAGSLTYVFCGYALLAGIRHPFFLTPMVYLPLILLGVEKIYRKESFVLFTVSVCLCAISNFYFFYMVAILVALYVVVRYFASDRQKSLKDALIQAGKFILYAVLGVAMAGVVFFPVVYVFLNSDRLDYSGDSTGIVYYLDYYKTLVCNMFADIDPEEWSCLTFAAPSFAALVTLFMTKRKHRGTKVALIVLFVMVMFPIFGKVMNGFSYVANRWTFALSLIIAFVVATVWEDMFALSLKQKIVLSVCTVIYIGLVLYIEDGIEINTIIALGCILAVTLLVWCIKSSTKQVIKSGVSLIIVGLIIMSAGVNAFCKYSSMGDNYASQFLEWGEINKKIENSSDSVAQTIKDSTFARNEQSKVTSTNASLITNTYGCGFYWSLENGTISDFLFENCLNSCIPQKYSNLDARTYLDAIASVKYYIDMNSGIVPYGYNETSKVKRGNNKFAIYENQYALPLGYTYSSYIDKDDYLALHPIQRQQAMVQGVVLEDTDELENYSQATPTCDYNSIEYELNTGKKTKLKDGHTIVTNKRKGTIELTFEGDKNCETYLFIKGLEYKGNGQPKTNIVRTDYTKKDSKLIFKAVALNPQISKSKVTSKIKYYSPWDRYYSGQQDYLVNFGYSEESKNKIKLTFPVKGEYSFDSIEVICQPMDNYAEQVTALAQDVMVNEQIGTNTVTGEINLSEDKILCLSIPYADGWTAYVDGEKTEILKANTMYMALPLTKGSHKIELKYSTPLIKLSAVIATVALVVFVALAVIYTVNKPKSKKAKNRDCKK